MRSVRRFPIYRSLIRYELSLGGERILVQYSALIAFLVGAGGQSILSFCLALAFWIAALFVFRRMAKIDPLLSKVSLKHVNQQDMYLARSGPWRRG